MVMKIVTTMIENRIEKVSTFGIKFNFIKKDKMKIRIYLTLLFPLFCMSFGETSLSENF